MLKTLPTARPRVSLPTYRLTLHRHWSTTPTTRSPRACWILLNPSTAEAHPEGKNDPTIRRCINLATHHGFASMVLVNIFSARATHPADLKRFADPIGPNNNAAIRRAARSADRVILGWGNHGSHLARADAVRALLAKAKIDCWCLGTTQTGEPRHPLYLPRTAPLIPYPLRPSLVTA